MSGRHQLAMKPYSGRISVLGLARRLTTESPTAHLEHLRTRLINARAADGLNVTVEWLMETELRDRTTT